MQIRNLVQAKSEIGKVIHRLEALTPAPEPLLWQQQPGGVLGVSPLLLGEWELLFASNGILVTRATPSELLNIANLLPGVGLSDITQVGHCNQPLYSIQTECAVPQLPWTGPG